MDVEDQTTEAMRRSQTRGEESTLVCGDPKQMVQIIYGVQEKNKQNALKPSRLVVEVSD